MKKMYRCRVCGFLIEREDPLDVCPACGVKGKIFEEYQSPLSKKRRKALGMHVHPVMVNFPIAFVFSMLGISLLMIIGVVSDQSVFSGMLKAMALILPPAAIIASIAGIYDGKLRFKKIKTPHLKKKLVLAGLFIVVSIALSLFEILSDTDQPSSVLLFLVFSIVLSILGGTLGLIGGKLIDSKVRG